MLGTTQHTSVPYNCPILQLYNLVSFFSYEFSSGCQTLNTLENNSRTVKGAQIIGQDNEALANVLLPLKRWSTGSQNPCR